MQVSGLSERYDDALETTKTTPPSPARIPSKKNTGMRHCGGGSRKRIIDFI